MFFRFFCALSIRFCNIFPHNISKNFSYQPPPPPPKLGKKKFVAYGVFVQSWRHFNFFTVIIFILNVRKNFRTPPPPPPKLQKNSYPPPPQKKSPLKNPPPPPLLPSTHPPTEIRKDNPLFWKHFFAVTTFFTEKEKPDPVHYVALYTDMTSCPSLTKFSTPVFFLVMLLVIWYWTMVGITEGPFKNDVTGVWGEGCHKCWIYCLKTSKLNSNLFGDKGGGGPTNETCLVCGVLNGPCI